MVTLLVDFILRPSSESNLLHLPAPPSFVQIPQTKDARHNSLACFPRENSKMDLSPPNDGFVRRTTRFIREQN
jgi:hypothetical protein